MPLKREAYSKSEPIEPWLAEAIEDWKLDRETGGSDPDIAYRFQKLATSQPDRALTLIVCLADEAKTEKDKIDVSETLEWLLQYHGQEYWEVLNVLCKKKKTDEGSDGMCLGSKPTERVKTQGGDVALIKNYCEQGAGSHNAGKPA